ncbi:TonB-dependent receptor [uncultured Sunxiuqinia sp.]|uniref:TonB-dependent receptor n=1 Tax=uncultured Sunxiuqinia sp. TaxID=1573825 RepID=UPI0026141817|nr:TonB-dependent receptor [uncultured Sunxiuqinia sp.]
MKLTAFFLLLGLVQVSAEVHSQNTKLNLEIKNQSLRSVLNVIEQSSNFRFFYSEDALSLDETVNIDVRNKDVNEVLNELFEGKDLAYSFQNNNLIVLKAMNSEQQDERVITGGVTGSDGTPIPGVSIVVEGTTNGTITDLDGHFTLEVPEEATALTVSYIGMRTETITLGNQASFQIVLEPDVIGVDEVVVVGYGTQQKKTLTGAVASVDETELRSVPAASAAAKLQGRVAGVTITNDNTPGGESMVRIRGIGSVNNNDPLYIIDGVPTTGGLSKINPNDIESMSVLKDASSSAIYGVRAANGVILVTTKRGKAGKPVLRFDARYGIQRTINSLDLLNSQEYGDLLWLESKNLGLEVGDEGWGNSQYGYGSVPVIPDYIIPEGAMASEVNESDYSYPSPYNGITRANKEGTDWYDEILDPAPIQEYNLSVSGGTEKGKYAFSGGYMSQDGVVIHTGFERFSLRSNADTKITDWLEIGESLGVSYTDRTGQGTNNDEGNSISQAYRMQPLIPVYDIAGNFAGTQAKTMGNGANPVAVLTRDKDDYYRDLRVLANAYAQVNVLSGLKLKTLIGADYTTTRRQDRTLTNPEFSEAIPTEILSQYYYGTFQYNWINTLNYETSINNEHNFNFLLGTEAVKWNYDWFQGGRSTFASTDLDYMVLDAGEKDQVANGSFDEWSTFSYFGRINYDYMGKYLAEAVVRRDASSRFSEDNRWGTFPAFSLGWRLSEEDFMSNTDWIDNLKLRFGWGKNGNDNVGGYYNAYTTYRVYNGESYYSLSGSNSATDAGIHKYKLGNPDGKWEASVTTNFGIDATMFNKLEVNLDVYKRVTTDMLYNQNLPYTYGRLVLPAVNIGEMENKGFDLMLSYREKIGRDLKLNLRANISHYKNEIVKLNENPNEILYGPSLRQNTYTATMTGEPISSFYGYVVDGIFNSWDEVYDHVPYNSESFDGDSYSQPGVFKYRDISGDGKIDAADRTVIGNPHPDFTYGINIDLEYKNWDMTMFFQGSQGNDLINYVNRWIMFNNFSGNRGKARLYESWTQERYNSGAKITQPIALRDDAVMQKNSSFFIEDGSYFRMKDLQIGYSLPRSLISKAGIESLRLYIQATNLFTITDYSGLDPELSNPDSNPDRLIGVDEGVYPTSRIFMFGVNLNL